MNDNPSHFVVIEQNGSELLRLPAFLMTAEAVIDTQQIYTDLYPVSEGYEVDLIEAETKTPVTIQCGKMKGLNSNG